MSFSVLVPFQRGSCFKGGSLIPIGINSIPVWKGDVVQKRSQDVTEQVHHYCANIVDPYQTWHDMVWRLISNNMRF